MDPDTEDVEQTAGAEVRNSALAVAALILGAGGLMLGWGLTLATPILRRALAVRGALPEIQSTIGVGAALLWVMFGVLAVICGYVASVRASLARGAAIL